MNEAMKLLPSLIALIAALLVGACSDAADPPPLHGAAIGGPFTLTNQDGRVVRDSDFTGSYRLIYFGYSYCPDVCPTDLQTIGQGLTRFEKAAPERSKRVQPVFISVDPERDTPAVLKAYVSAFHPRLVGLTGSAADIDKVKKSFAIFSSKQPEQAPGTYLVDHSRQAVLLGPSGEPVALVPQDEGAEAVAAALERWVR